MRRRDAQLTPTALPRPIASDGTTLIRVGGGEVFAPITSAAGLAKLDTIAARIKSHAPSAAPAPAVGNAALATARQSLTFNAQLARENLRQKLIVAVVILIGLIAVGITGAHAMNTLESNGTINHAAAVISQANPSKLAHQLSNETASIGNDLSNAATDYHRETRCLAHALNCVTGVSQGQIINDVQHP